MASKSSVAKMKKIRKMSDKYAEKRAQLKKEGRWDELALLPRNSSPTRYRNRCMLTGRARAYYRKFGVSRIVLRDLARQGMIPGMRKASW